MITDQFKILIVDDSSTSRGQIRLALEEARLLVTEARDGSEALWRAREDHFDLVITDIHMPVMDGLTFVRELRGVSGYGSVPIVVLTSDGGGARPQEGKAAGATAWLIKPPQLPALVSGVVKLIEKTAGRAGMASTGLGQEEQGKVP